MLKQFRSLNFFLFENWNKCWNSLKDLCVLWLAERLQSTTWLKFHSRMKMQKNTMPKSNLCPAGWQWAHSCCPPPLPLPQPRPSLASSFPSSVSSLSLLSPQPCPHSPSRWPGDQWHFEFSKTFTFFAGREGSGESCLAQVNLHLIC